MSELSTLLAKRGIDGLTALKRRFDYAAMAGALVVGAHPTAAVAVGTATDATLAPAIPAGAGNVINQTMLNRVAFYGGRGPVIVGGTFMANPVTRVPGSNNGSLSTLVASSGGNIDAKDNQCSWSFECHVDGGVLEAQVWGAPFRWFYVLVDDRYVGDSTTGYNAASGSNQGVYLKVTGIPTGSRVRVMVPTENASNVGYLISLRHAVNGQIWKPAPELKMGVPGDSYSVGVGPQSAANQAQAVGARANAPFPLVLADTLGIRDVRQFGLGSTGRIANGNGGSGTSLELVPNWGAQAPFDLIVDTHGFNDRNLPASAQAYIDLVVQNIRLVRQYHAGAYVLLGSQCGSRGATDAGTLLIENAIKAGVDQVRAGGGGFAPDPLVAFAPVTTADPPYIDGTGKEGTTNGTGNSDKMIGTDGTHPNVIGSAHIGRRAGNSVRQAITQMLLAA